MEESAIQITSNNPIRSNSNINGNNIELDEVFRLMWTVQLKLRGLLTEYGTYLELFKTNTAEIRIKARLEELLVQIKQCGQEQNKVINSISESTMNQLADESHSRLSLLLDPLRNPEFRKQCDKELFTVPTDLLRRSGTEKMLFTREVGLQLINSDNKQFIFTNRNTQTTSPNEIPRSNSSNKNSSTNNKRKSANKSNLNNSTDNSQLQSANENLQESQSPNQNKRRLTMSSGIGRGKRQSANNKSKSTNSNSQQPTHQIINNDLIVCCGICHCIYGNHISNSINEQNNDLGDNGIKVGNGNHRTTNTQDSNNKFIICETCCKNYNIALSQDCIS